MTELRAVEFGPLEAAGTNGLATPLLLLHGIGAGASVRVPAARTLATRRRALVPDLLGFGTPPWLDVSYGVHDHLSAILNLLERRRLAAGPLDVAGHSMGAILAAELPDRLGHRARRIALSKRSVQQYRQRGPVRPPSQTWRSFLANHRPQIWAADLLTVHTLTYRTL